MEGDLKKYLFLILILLILYFSKHPLGVFYNDFVLCNLIWVYNVNTQSLVEGAPFKTKTECAKTLSINPRTINSHLDKDKVLHHKWVFSSSVLDKESLSKWCVPLSVWEAMVGNLLGDGSSMNNHRIVDSWIVFTIVIKRLEYIKHLKEVVYAPICTLTPPTPYPNRPVVEPTQYWFASKALPSLTESHLRCLVY